MRTSIFIPIAMLSLAVCGFWNRAAIGSDERAKEVTTKPLAVVTDKDSEVREPRYLRVTSDGPWQRVWHDHLGTRQENNDHRMDVDFDRCMVLAVFRGVRVNCSGVLVAGVTERSDSITVRLDDISYQTGAVGQTDNGDRNTPYAFVILPKSDKPIVLEENVQMYLGEPPVWKELTRLAAK